MAQLNRELREIADLPRNTFIRIRIDDEVNEWLWKNSAKLKQSINIIAFLSLKYLAKEDKDIYEIISELRVKK